MKKINNEKSPHEMALCAACREPRVVKTMEVCMHNQMHRYVCNRKCMNDFYKKQ